MNQPPSLAGRPETSGLLAPELRIARIRGHARRLTLPALILIAVAAACGYFPGNLPESFEDWMLLAAAVAVVFVFCLIPFLIWRSRTYTITTRRVVARCGVLSVHKRELTHVRGYTIQVRRGLLQRLWRTGTLTLSNGVDEPIRLTNISQVYLVHEVLSDQIEINQILAHRDSRPTGQILT